MAKPLLPVLAKALEDRLWAKAHRVEGWVRVNAQGVLGDSLLDTEPTFDSAQRGLLLVHGTFSHTASGFRGLAQNGALDVLASVYGDRIFGFNHFTISKSPLDNARELLTRIRKPTKKKTKSL